VLSRPLNGEGENDLIKNIFTFNATINISIRAGIDQLYDLGIDAIFGILPGIVDLSTAIATGQENLARTAENIARVIK